MAGATRSRAAQRVRGAISPPSPLLAAPTPHDTVALRPKEMVAPVPSKSEGRCCDAVVRLLEGHMEAERGDLHIPDRIDRMRKKRVDVCVAVGSSRYALEHTRIEPFSRAIETGKRVADLLYGVKKRLCACEHLPGPALYELKLPKDPRLGGGPNARERHAKIEQEMAAWIHSQSTALYARASDAGRPTCIRREFSGLLVHLVCTRMGPPSETTPGEFGPVRDAPEPLDPEEQRDARLRQALEKKCPKLRFCKDRGARTVLVLESDDIALSGAISIREALGRATEARDDVPDEVYLVHTGVDDDYWYVFPMNAGADASFGSVPYPDGCIVYRTFRSSKLKDLNEASYGAEAGCKFCVDG